MENQNEREVWNERWERQMALWQVELWKLVEQMEALVVLIELAESQIEQDPPE